MTARVTNGDEPGIREAVAWLERRGVEKKLIRGITIVAHVGEPMLIIPTIMIDPAELEPAGAPDLAPSDG